MVEIYCDGAASKNGQEGAIGGWGFVLLEDDRILIEGCGKIINGTNNQGEMTAIIRGIEAYLRCEGEADEYNVRIYSDSSYCIQGITEWINGWKRNGWQTANKKPVKNKELWQKIDKYNSDDKINIEWIWMRGHNGNKWNEYVDKLAVKGRSE